MIDFLIVEDSTSKRENICSLLSEINKDFDITYVDNFEDAVEKIKKRSFSFVVLDIQIPNTSIDQNKNSQGGVELLKWIKHKQKSGVLSPPKNILVLTEYEDLLNKYSETNKSYRVFTYLYDSTCSSWRNQVREHIEEYILTTSSNIDSMPNNKVVYSVHGINTHGEWQKDFGRYIDGTQFSYIHVPYDYLYYPLTSFLCPHLRTEEVDRLVEDLIMTAKKYPNATVQLVGHSFGTYLIAEALAKLPVENAPKFDKIVLNGSVLKSNFNWSKIVEKHGISKIINNCSLQDKALLASQSVAIGLGMAGREGFKGKLTNIIENRYYKGGHSACLNKTQFEEWFTFFEQNEIQPHDHRSTVNLPILLKNTGIAILPICVPIILFLLFWNSIS
ncbi:response regulator receiver protein [Aliivibrio fischeri MJ11]|uniref:Response regulator receiver protein n=1 Tax=Aliivibrio fischeri (strain MJ11) TaxID=388396 RepID=B5FDK8_ALIFM|nr:response regulator [Aliivibrio fischeri]ACH65287.1 response regulator receiver protein [Aliivibrio fischeri MJ11]